MNKWNFDLDYLNYVVKKGNIMLQDKKLTNKTKKLITDDIKMFEGFINNCYDLPSEEGKYDDSYSFSKLKRIFLKEAFNHYNFLGDDLIDFIINLSEEQIFNDDWCFYSNILPFDKQVELTLETYSSVSSKLYNLAKKIILDESVSQIQVVNDLDASSYCHYSDIVKLPFLIVDPDETNNLFNHEIQHAIEDVLKLKVPSVFLELGSITLELLFNDTLFLKQNYLCIDDYNDRIEELSFHLKELHDYFKLLKKLKIYNFDVNNKEFINLLVSNVCVNVEDIKYYLIEKLNDCDYDLYMCYAFSCLKAIELREKINNSKCDILELLNSYYVKHFDFRIPKDKYKVYERYVDEMKQKTKRIK